MPDRIAARRSRYIKCSYQRLARRHLSCYCHFVFSHTLLITSLPGSSFPPLTSHCACYSPQFFKKYLFSYFSLDQFSMYSKYFVVKKKTSSIWLAICEMTRLFQKRIRKTWTVIVYKNWSTAWSVYPFFPLLKNWIQLGTIRQNPVR